MSEEDLVGLARTERARSYADLERDADQTLSLYATWREKDGLTDQQIRTRLKWAPQVGADAVELFQQLTTVGASPDTAAEVAAQAAAALQVRAQVGAPEHAEAVRGAFDTLTEQVAAGRDQAAASADFREAVAGWRGDGYAEGPLGQPVMVAFADGTVVPDGVELAGVRETGARHSIITPPVQAGIDAYLIARAEGVEHETAVDLTGDGPGVRGAVAQFAADVEYYEVDVTTARDAAVASVVADAAIGQFLSLRNAGTDIDQAAATATGGDPVAVHAIAGFVARVRDGFPEDVAEPDAWAAAVAAARFRGEDYRGSIPEGFELPGFEDAHRVAQAALDAHTAGTEPVDPGGIGAGAVSRFERLTRHGMDPSDAARLAAADTAEQQARMRVRNEFNVLDAAQTVIRDLQHELDPAYHDADETTEEFGDDGSGPDVPDMEQAAAGQLAFDSTYDVADAAVALFEQVRRYGRDAADARGDVLGTFAGDDVAVAGAALDRYSDHRGAGYDHDTARGLASQETAERMTPQYTTEDPGVARSIPDTSASEAVVDDPPVREEHEEMAPQDAHSEHPTTADDDVEVVVIDPAELMLAEDALRNYDTAAEAVDRFAQLTGEGWTDDEAAARVAAASEDETGLAAAAVQEYRRQRAQGINHETAHSATVIDTADRFTPRVSAETAQEIAAAFAEPAPFAVGDVVRDRRSGEVMTVTDDAVRWDPHYYEPADTAAGAGIPEREPKPDSWIARNLPVAAQTAQAGESVADDGPAGDFACIWCNGHAGRNDFCSTTCRDRANQSERAEIRQEQLNAQYDQAIAAGMPIEDSAAWWAQHGVAETSRDLRDPIHVAGDIIERFEQLAALGDEDTAAGTTLQEFPHHAQLAEVTIEQVRRRRRRERTEAEEAAEAELEDGVGEPDVNDAPWRSAPPAESPVPERAPEPGSWIARNVAGRGPVGPPVAGSMAAAEQDPQSVAAVAEHVAECGNESGTCGMCNDWYGTGPTVSSNDERAAEDAGSAAAAVDAMSHNEETDAGGTRQAEHASWIDRNLPDRTNGAGDTAAERESDGWVAEYEQRRANGEGSNAAQAAVAMAHPKQAAAVSAAIDRHSQRQYDEGCLPAARSREAQGHAAKARAAAARTPAASESDQPSRSDTDAVVDRIDAVLEDEDPASAPLGAQVAECEQAVQEAEDAVRHADAAGEDSARAERCARWNTDDHAAENDDDARELG